jgi:hypothetical protein
MQRVSAMLEAWMELSAGGHITMMPHGERLLPAIIEKISNGLSNIGTC